MKILTDVREPRISVEWERRSDFRSEIVGGKGILSDIKAVIHLFSLYQNYDIVIIGGSRKGSLFTMLLALWPGENIPVIMIDCLWYKPQNLLLQRLKRLQYKLIARSVTKFVVWASHEVRDYANVFSIPENKFLYIPHHHTLEGYEFEISEGDYIFSGGDGDRDYATLIEAVRDLDIRVIIATRLKDWSGGIPIPPNVHAFPVTHEDFRKLMAGSKMVVIPMKKGFLHSGGQQTYLNAMAMGKPVIVADDRGAKDYIQDGVNGLIVPAEDDKILRSAIRKVLEDEALAKRLANNAKKTYETFSTPKCMETILEIAEKIIKKTEMEF